jgi:hypothetical protein
VKYRRTVALDRETDYWHVRMGRRDHLNGPASYPFPSVGAATRFAQVSRIPIDRSQVHWAWFLSSGWE